MAGPTTALRTRSRSRARNDENIDPNVGDPQQVNPSAVNVTVAGAGLDIYIPTIPENLQQSLQAYGLQGKDATRQPQASLDFAYPSMV